MHTNFRICTEKCISKFKIVPLDGDSFFGKAPEQSEDLKNWSLEKYL